MTKTEARDFMTAEIFSCISKDIAKNLYIPSHIKIDFKGTKNFISFDSYGEYLCFYVTSELNFSFRTLTSKQNNISLIEYEKERDKKELKVLVKNAFTDAMNCLRGVGL